MISFREFHELPEIDQVTISTDGDHFELLQEGKWVSGRFERNIRIDQPTHGVGQAHAHVFGRRGELIGVVNLDGIASHGTQAKLNSADADELRKRGFEIKPGNIVEWTELAAQPNLLLG